MIDGDNLKNGLSNIGEQVGELLKYITDLEKENAELSNSVTELNNSKIELENKVIELNKQIEKMKCCGNCKHFSFPLNVCYAHERQVWKTFEDTIPYGQWELAK